MLDQRDEVCKQVEVNTIAAGHGWIGTACAKFHRYILDELEVEYCDNSLPLNVPIDGLCRAFADAWEIYDQPRAVVLFVVEECERNIGDYHEYRVRELEPRTRVLRRSLGHVCKFGKLEGPYRRLIVDECEVALVYYRSGYAPKERNCWTLMDRIAARVHRNYLVRPNYRDGDRAVDVTSEIGIFGAVIGDEERIFSSKVVGHMLRSKLAEVDEGGVSSGFGACDSPYLV